MLNVKKLFFAPLFLISLSALIYQLSPLLKSYDFIFSLSIDTLIQLIALSALISLSSFLFILFVTLALDWRLTVPLGILTLPVPFVFLEATQALVFSVGILVSLLLTSLNLESSLKSYLTFQPNSLLGPPIRHLSQLLILTICVVYFLSANKIIAQNGFQIPDSLIDTALKFSQPQTNELQSLTNNLIKSAVKTQIQDFIKPYLSFIPATLAILLFLTLQSLTSLINLLIYPLLWLIFFILEKSGFIKFEIEQRPVKKMVV